MEAGPAPARRHRAGAVLVPGPAAAAQSPGRRGLRHLAFRVAALDAAIAHLQAEGVACEPVRVDEYTGRRFTFFADPDGLPLELYELP